MPIGKDSIKTRVAKVSAEETAAETPAEVKPAKAPAKKAASPKKPAAPSENQAGKVKNTFNVSIQQALSKAKYDTHVIGFVSSAASKAYGDTKIRQTVYRQIIKQYGQKQGLAIYNEIKPLL